MPLSTLKLSLKIEEITKIIVKTIKIIIILN
jgi:hypothetical protein